MLVCYAPKAKNSVPIHRPVRIFASLRKHRSAIGKLYRKKYAFFRSYFADNEKKIAARII